MTLVHLRGRCHRLCCVSLATVPFPCFLLFAGVPLQRRGLSCVHKKEKRAEAPRRPPLRPAIHANTESRVCCSSAAAVHAAHSCETNLPHTNERTEPRRLVECGAKTRMYVVRLSLFDSLLQATICRSCCSCCTWLLAASSSHCMPGVRQRPHETEVLSRIRPNQICGKSESREGGDTHGFLFPPRVLNSCMEPKSVRCRMDPRNKSSFSACASRPDLAPAPRASAQSVRLALEQTHVLGSLCPPRALLFIERAREFVAARKHSP